MASSFPRWFCVCLSFLSSCYCVSTPVLLFSAIPFLSTPSASLVSSSYGLFSLCDLSHSAQNSGLHCFCLILSNQTTIPFCHLNKGNPEDTDIWCKSPCKLRCGKYTEPNKQQRHSGQPEFVSYFNSSVTSFWPIILRFQVHERDTRTVSPKSTRVDSAASHLSCCLLDLQAYCWSAFLPALSSNIKATKFQI